MKGIFIKEVVGVFKEESTSECNGSVGTVIIVKKTIRKGTLNRVDQFKAGLRTWMKCIIIEPTSKFPVLCRVVRRPSAPPAPRLNIP